MVKLIKNSIVILIIIFSFSCAGGSRKCDKIDPEFRPHKVTHHHKGKTYYYYHNTPCDCTSVKDDLNEGGFNHYEPAEIVEFYDNGERRYGPVYKR